MNEPSILEEKLQALILALRAEPPVLVLSNAVAGLLETLLDEARLAEQQQGTRDR